MTELLFRESGFDSLVDAWFPRVERFSLWAWTGNLPGSS